MQDNWSAVYDILYGALSRVIYNEKVHCTGKGDAFSYFQLFVSCYQDHNTKVKMIYRKLHIAYYGIFVIVISNVSCFD